MKNNLFETTRLRLTLWYLLIIMAVSLVFSFAIYRLVSRQIEGFIRMQNNRFNQFWQAPLPPPATFLPRRFYLIETQELINQKQQLLYSLILLNFAILILSGSGGYFLAGQTLAPIKQMLDDQLNFISNSSHELRTPIAVLRSEMEASLLQSQMSRSQARQLIVSNLEEVGRLQQLTDRLLSLAQISPEKISGNFTLISISQLVQSAVSHLAPLAAQKQITIKNNVKSGTVYGASDRLEEVLVILLDNAIKYSPNSSIVTLVSQTQANFVSISVADQGIGISSADLPHLFERFYRADKSRSQIPGFGLGLSIAQNIVRAHQGKISVQSTPKAGSVFTVTFPQSPTSSSNLVAPVNLLSYLESETHRLWKWVKEYIRQNFY
jgi:signal transduction histidine kinase